MQRTTFNLWAMVARLELTGRAGEEEEDDVLLRALCDVRENGVGEEAAEARDAGRAGSREALEKEPAMEAMLVRRAGAGSFGLGAHGWNRFLTLLLNPFLASTA